MKMRNVVDDLVAGKKRDLTLNIIFRSYDDGSVVAECLEIPGCLAQGDTEEEAKINIADAIDSCLSVMLEDAIKAGMCREMNFVGIKKQETVTVEAPRIHKLVTV